MEENTIFKVIKECQSFDLEKIAEEIWSHFRLEIKIVDVVKIMQISMRDKSLLGEKQGQS